MTENEHYEQQPTANLEAEEYILGAMMLSPRAIDLVLDEGLVTADFYRASHGLIFDAILTLYVNGEATDAVSVAEKLAEQALLEKAGGKERISEIASLVPAATNAGHHARIVRENAMLRGLATAGFEIRQWAMERGMPVREIMERSEGLIFTLAQERSRRDFTTMGEAVRAAYARIEASYQSGANTITGLQTGYQFLDRLTSGLQNGNLVVLAARPSMGKTALALGITANVAVRQRIPVVVFTMEMSESEVTERLLSSESLIESEKIRSGQLTSEEWGRLANASGHLEQAPILIDDTALVSATELRSRARKAKLRYPNLGLVVVDYLQLMTSGMKSDNRVQDVSQISRTLKVLARELETPVLALSQLSRAVEQRHDKRPILSDLRESGSVEQDADLVAFIYRDEYYNPETAEEDGTAGLAEVLVAKHRNGPTGVVKLAFVRRNVRFSDIAPNER